jgi:hypothetical protein
LTLTDFQMQRVVLALVLREYPILLMLPALAGLVLPDSRSLVGCVTLARAVRDLAERACCSATGFLSCRANRRFTSTACWG